MKIYLDDERPTPVGWTSALTSQEAIKLLGENEVSEISLDHDLGDEDIVGTGYKVLLWIEEQVAVHNYLPPKIHIHTANASARIKMKNGVEAINRMLCKK